MRYLNKVYIRKSKKTNEIEVVYKYCGKIKSKVLYESYDSSEKHALKYAWLLAQDTHAILINLINKEVNYY